MKQKRKVSVLIALMLMLTVFAVPSMAFGAEEDYYDYGISPVNSAEWNQYDYYLAIGKTLDLNATFNIINDDTNEQVNKSEWTWKVENSDSYLDETDAPIATVDANGILTGKTEGKVSITAQRKSDGKTTYGEYLKIGYIYESDGVRVYPDRTAKVMRVDQQNGSATCAVPTQYIIEKPDAQSYDGPGQNWYDFLNKWHGTYPVKSIAKDALLSGIVKKVIVPDSVTSIGAYALGYDRYYNSRNDKLYTKVKGFTIYGSSNNTAASRYAKANGFTYKNMDAKQVTVTATPKVTKPKKVANVKAKAGKKQMTVTWKRNKNAKGYQITYSQKKNFKKAKNVAITKNKTTKKVIKKLKSDKKYYVKVRAYKKAGNKKVYGAYSKVKTVKIK